MYQWILFDLDGTLTDPKEGITKCIQYALRDGGIEIEDLSKLEKYIGPPLLHSFREYFDGEAATRAVEKYRERYAEKGIHENKLYDGMEEVLQALRLTGKKTALATSKIQHFAEQVIQYYHLESYFDLVIGAADDQQSKADVINEVLRQAGMEGEKRSGALMVGDRKYDIEGAKECGIDSLGVRFGYAKEGELEEAGATAIVTTVEELKEFLLTH